MTDRSQTAGDQEYDVAILGAGIAGSLLATVLARNGVRTLLLDAGTHPRFAIGESTIPYTSVLLRLLAERYRVPEIKHLASFHALRKHVTSSGGIKRNFGFVYHDEGGPQRPERINQFVIPKLLHHENHLFRQDVDAYTANLAVRYGATLRQQVRVEDMDIDDAGVRLGGAGGEEFRARYLVDGSGHKSPVARKFGLREEPTRLEHHSRSLFTHMIGVRPFDEVMAPRSAYNNPSPWHQGTLHHVFDGGWMWVIPFDNHPGSKNQLCSVGLTLDPRRFDSSGGDPRTEFDAFLARFPDIARQFETARPVRDWVSTGRLQYSATRTVGDRFCVTAHAAGFVDALFSRGLTNTLEVINALGYRLIQASRDGDFSAERFRFVQDLEQGLLDANDDMVHSAFVGFRDYDLWDATFRTWAISTVLGTFLLEGAYDRLRRTGSDRELRELENAKYLGSPFPTHVGCNELLQRTTDTCREVEAGELGSGEASRRIFADLGDADFIPPPLGLAERSNKFFHATPPKMARSVRWAMTRAPREMREIVTGAIGGFVRERVTRRD
ncbi:MULTISPECIES: tryptophan 7-halogenase [unclassified Actinopolyspora]|uniref:NAD(P)/FAD-dependent oxidoreductase n=1 Tax=unclassified Actinopolyspora TaxID=2639451 RepID=UPI0013F68230|nr:MULTISPECIES: tryptophan 7-halogenase [unclassified Actinopolyspora]NHD15969.1 NAD(P)-binding protein [Actinopolyspora sp. BKK2]NHE74817.1 NAD(P)-binding protein [Actinopolyspora sp. BKK1]